MHTDILLGYSAKARRELTNDILPFWVNNVLLKHGMDFAGQMQTDLTVIEDAPKGIILISRILWTFSAAYVALGEASHKACADAYFNLFKPFVDQNAGGVFWLRDADFEPRDTKKENIAQAFAIYGLAEYYKATHNASALEMAIALFHAVEKHSHDPHGSGYLDGHDRKWQQVTEPVKSFETHYNLMNAYANLSRVWDDALLRTRLKELIEIMLDKFTDSAWHMQHFFGADWSPRPNRIQYGHDIIVSWLLVDCAEALGDSQLIARAKQHAVKLARGVLQQAYDHDLGGIYNSISAEGRLNTDKVWWCQAEAVVGFLNAYAIGGDQQLLDAALRTWDFIDQHLIDRQYGEWYYSTSKEGLAHTDLLKVSEWKCPYHNGRACLEVIKRMNRIV